MKCIKCKVREVTEYDEMGLGKFCEECLDEENKLWSKEEVNDYGIN